MVISIGPPFDRSTMALKDNKFKPNDFKWSERPARLQHRFLVLRKLGQGTYGKVQLALNKETNQEVAIKTIKKARIESEEDMLRIRREIHIMTSIRHPHIIHINEVFETRQKIVLVMQYASGGELYDYLGCHHTLPEKEARRIFRQIASAIYYCHKNKICHRDLKLENILLDEEGNAQIADFGLSNIFDERRRMNTFCGSPLYASPEIVKGTPYKGPEVDCWSLGVLLYTLIYGTMPFDGRNFKELVSQISEGRYEEPINKSSASGLIRRLLTPEIPSRATISDVCKDSWVNQEYNESLLKIAETMALESLLKTRKLGSAKISSEQSIKNGSMKTVFQTTKLGLDQRNEENNSVTNHCGIINDDSENLSSVNGHGSQKAYLYEQILNYDVSFVINKLLVAVESALACPMMEINTKTLVTTVKEKSLSAFKPWPRNGENNLATKVESAYVIPIFEVTSVMPRMTSKNAIIQNNKKGPQICFTPNSIQNETMLQTSELDSNTVIKNKLKTKNIESSIQNQPKKSSLTIGDSKESLRQNGVEFSKQGADLGNQNAVSTEVEAPKSSTDSAENDEPKDISQVKNLMLQENILSRIPSVKIKRAHDNHLFGQKHFGPFFRSKNHSLSLARIFSMKYEKLVLNTFKVPDRKQKPPGRITIPATFDPATSPNHVQERKEIILFPTVSVSENKQKIEKKIDKIKKAALNMNLIRRSNSKNRLRIQKYLKSQAKKIQDLVCDEQRSLAGSMEHINGSDGFPTVSESYFGRFEKGNLNSLNIKLHNKKINFIYSSTNNSNNPFAFDFFSGAKGKSTDSENSLMEQRENFGIAKSKSDIHFPINYTTCNSSNEGYRSSNGLGYNRSSNILNVTNGDCLLVRSASDSEGLNFLKHMSNIYGCEEKFIFPELNTPYLHVDEQSNHNESLFYHDSENLNNIRLTGKANHQVGLRSDLCLSEDTHIAKSCQNESKSIKSTNCNNKGNFTVHRSISTNNCTGFQNFTANDLQNIKRLLLTPLSENVKYNDKIGIESNNNSKQKLNMMNNTKSFLWGANTVTEDECGTTNVKQKFLRRRNSFSGVPVCNDHPIHSYLENTRGKSVDSGMGTDDYFWIPDSKQELLLVHQNETTSFSSSPNLGHLSLGKEINYKMVNDSRGIDNLNIQTKVGSMDFYETSPSLLSSAHNSIGKSALLRRILQASDNDGTYYDFSKNGANRAKSISEDVLAHLENDDVLRKTQSERKLSLPQSIIGRQNNQRKSPFLSKFLNDLENREQFPNAAGSSLNQRRHLRNPPTFGKRPKLEKKSKSFLQLLSLKRIQEAEKELEKTERNHRIEAEEEENSGSLLEALKTHGYKGVISQRFQGAENDSSDPYNLKGCVSSYLSRKISPDISLFNPMHYGTFPHFSTSMYEDNDSDIFNGISMRSLYEMYPSHRQNSPKQFVYDWLTTSHNGDYPTPFKIDQDSLLDSEKSNHTQEPESPLHWGKESAKSFDEEVSSSESFETPKEQYTNGTLNNESNRTRDNLTEYADLPNHARSDRNPLLRTSSASEDEKEESVQDRIWRKSFYSRFNNSALSRKERSSFLESPQLASESRASFRENCLSPFKVTLRDGTDYVKLNGNNKDPQSKRIHTAKKYSSTNDVTTGCAKTKPSKSTKHFPLERTETATTLTAEMDEPEH